eukprot:gene2961-7920_t
MVLEKSADGIATTFKFCECTVDSPAGAELCVACGHPAHGTAYGSIGNFDVLKIDVFNKIVVFLPPAATIITGMTCRRFVPLIHSGRAAAARMCQKIFRGW